MNSLTLFIRFSIVFLTYLLLAGCEEDLGLREPLGMPFTLYGVLSPDLDTQSVYVYPFEDFPSLAPAESLDISFIFTDLSTGTQTTWQDTLLTSPNGQRDLVFWAPLRVEYDRSYRVEAIRESDGETSFAEIRIPPRVTVRLIELGSPAINKVNLKIQIEGEQIRVLKPEIVYHVKRFTGPDGVTGPDRFIPISYLGLENKTATGWDLSINLWKDRFDVQTLYTAEFMSGGVLCPLLDLKNMNLHMIVGDSIWDPPMGLFDMNILSDPNTLTNVKNGLGFVGGGYRSIHPILPSQESVEDACFYYAF